MPKKGVEPRCSCLNSSSGRLLLPPAAVQRVGSDERDVDGHAHTSLYRGWTLNGENCCVGLFLQMRRVGLLCLLNTQIPESMLIAED
jgi:hypothetical protein